MIINKTKKTVISKKHKLLNPLFAKSRGLILKNKIETIVFRTCFGIHTFFVKDEIDVFILDKDNKIVKIVKNLKQNRVFIWSLSYNLVVELPKNALEKSDTTLGDEIIFT